MDYSTIAEHRVWKYFRDGSKRKTIHRFNDTKDASLENFRKSERNLTVMKSTPSDFIITENSVMYFAEVKTTISTVGVTSSLFKQQAKERTLILSAGGKYFYFIYSVATAQWFKVPGQYISENPNRKWSELSQYKIYYLEPIQ